MPRRRQLSDGLPDEHGRRGAAPADGTEKASSCPCLLLPRSSYNRNTDTAQNPNPFSVNPLVKPLSHPKTPGKNAKNAARSPRFAGPAPTATTENPDAFGQYPAGSRSEDDP